MTPEELLPCPFCGGEAASTGEIKYSDTHEAWWGDGTRITRAYFCNCISCGVTNQGLCGHQTRALAIAAWNTRTPSKAEEERDEAHEALREIVMITGNPDPSDGEGTSPRQVVSMVEALSAERDTLRTSLAQAEQRVGVLECALASIQMDDPPKSYGEPEWMQILAGDALRGEFQAEQGGAQ